MFTCKDCGKKLANRYATYCRKCLYSNGHFKTPVKAFKKGHKSWNDGRELPHLTGENAFHWKGGRPHCPICNKKLNYNNKYCRIHANQLRSGENHSGWKGDGVSYSGIHKWVEKSLGRPNKCVICGCLNKRYTWANISHEYKRDKEDWISLCYSCHKNYDLGNIINLYQNHL